MFTFVPALLGFANKRVKQNLLLNGSGGIGSPGDRHTDGRACPADVANAWRANPRSAWVSVLAHQACYERWGQAPRS